MKAFTTMKILFDLHKRIAKLERKRVNENWRQIKISEQPIYLNDVWEMYVKTYRKIGHTINNPKEFSKYKIWYLHFENDIPIAFNLFKKTAFGLKSGLSGSDMSQKGKSASKEWIKTRWHLVPNFYGEVSGAVEHISIKSGIPVICASYAEKILNKSISAFREDNIHYERIIGSKPHDKVLVGKPKGVRGLPFKKALISCPLPESSGRVARHEKTSALEDRLASDCSIYENSLF